MEPAIASPFTDESRPSADGRSVIRQSHDEPNLAEFPLVLLTTQSPKDRHTLEYQDIERHPRTGVTITRKVTITGAGKFGLPTSRDEDVLMALTYLTLEDKSKTGFDDPMVYFTRRKLLEILDWPDTGHYYKRLKEALTRWKGVNIYYENWWDNLAQDYVPETEGFSILDNFKLSDARRKDHSQLILPLDDNQHKQSLCYIKWNMTPFAGFKNGNLRTLDLDKFFSLPTAAAKRAYRYLNLRLPDSGHQEFDLRTFAFQHVGFSENYKPGRLRNQVQETIVAPLEQTEFIEKMPPKRRFLKQNGRDRIVFARKASANLSASRPDQTPLLQQDCPPAPSVTACPALSPLSTNLPAAIWAASWPLNSSKLIPPTISSKRSITSTSRLPSNRSKIRQDGSVRPSRKTTVCPQTICRARNASGRRQPHARPSRELPKPAATMSRPAVTNRSNMPASEPHGKRSMPT